MSIDRSLILNAQNKAGSNVHRVNNLIQAYIYWVFNLNRQTNYVEQERMKGIIDGLEVKLRMFCAGNIKILYEEIVYS
jgi:hypothetical protein